MIRIIVPGRIAGKGRPRAVIRGGRIGTYTPDKTRNAEAMVRCIASEAMAGHAMIDGPVALEMRVYITPPVSWSRKRRENTLYVTGKPDSDNIVKLAADALNGIVYRDDSQIAILHMERWYTLAGPERVEVTIRELTSDAVQAVAA